MADYKFVVLTNPVPGREAEYNDWYDNRHLDDVLAVPGFVAAQRFVLDDPGGGAGHGYLAIYDVETDDVAATFAALGEAAASGAAPVSDALDRASVSAVMFRARGLKRVRGG